MDLKQTDYVMFGFNYHGGVRDGVEPKETIVDNITAIYEDRVLVHFLYGHHSLSEFVPFDKIVGIGDNENGTVQVKGWGGKYRVVNQELFDQYVEKGIIELND